MRNAVFFAVGLLRGAGEGRRGFAGSYPEQRNNDGVGAWLLAAPLTGLSEGRMYPRTKARLTQRWPEAFYLLSLKETRLLCASPVPAGLFVLGEVGRRRGRKRKGNVLVLVRRWVAEPPLSASALRSVYILQLLM